MKVELENLFAPIHRVKVKRDLKVEFKIKICKWQVIDRYRGNPTAIMWYIISYS